MRVWFIIRTENFNKKINIFVDSRMRVRNPLLDMKERNEKVRKPLIYQFLN